MKRESAGEGKEVAKLNSGAVAATGSGAKAKTDGRMPKSRIRQREGYNEQANNDTDANDETKRIRTRTTSFESTKETVVRTEGI